MRGLQEPSFSFWHSPRRSFKNLFAALVVPIRTSTRRFSRSPSPIPYKGRSGSRSSYHTSFLNYRLIINTILLICLLVALVASFTATFFPSYTRLPPHYIELQQNAKGRSSAGRANPRQEKVFIAASLYDPTGEFVGGRWGNLVEELIDLLGPHNTFLSIYESDSGLPGAAALSSLESRISCDYRFTVEDQVTPEHSAVINLPDGATAIKRIDYLAAARNRALEPLHAINATQFDKILYLNDVLFDPIEAAQLLFSTNQQPDGSTSYKAACALDFKSPFLMYDKFALRDNEGWGSGVPLYPYLTTAGLGQSRTDVMAQKDSVRVKSCWGGLVAFDAKNFQSRSDDPSRSLVRFRSEGDLFWEYSECCLIHADLQELSSRSPAIPGQEADTQIYLNPYIRTAYAEKTFNWLSLGRRLERLVSPIQRLINYYARLPYDNERRLVKSGQPLSQMVYEYNKIDGTSSWNMDTVPAKAGGFCGIRNLMVKRLDHTDIGVDKNWETVSKASWDLMPQPRRHPDDP